MGHKNNLNKLLSIFLFSILFTGTFSANLAPFVFAQESESTTDPPADTSTTDPPADTSTTETPAESADTSTLPTDQSTTLEHDPIVINEAVTWTQIVNLASSDNVAIEIPADAQITLVETSTGETVDSSAITTSDTAPADSTVVSIPDPQMLQDGADTTLAVIDQAADGYNIEFQTPAPYTVEQDTTTPELYQKEVTVAHDSALHYTDIKSYSDIPEDLVTQGVEFKLYWMVDGVKPDVTFDPRFAVEFVDS